VKEIATMGTFGQREKGIKKIKVILDANCRSDYRTTGFSRVFAHRISLLYEGCGFNYSMIGRAA